MKEHLSNHSLFSYRLTLLLRLQLLLFFTVFLCLHLTFFMMLRKLEACTSHDQMPDLPFTSLQSRHHPGHLEPSYCNCTVIFNHPSHHIACMFSVLLLSPEHYRMVCSWEFFLIRVSFIYNVELNIWFTVLVLADYIWPLGMTQCKVEFSCVTLLVNDISKALVFSDDVVLWKSLLKSW